MRKFDQAIKHYRRSLETIPDPGVVHNNLGSALQETGKLEEAGQHFREALRMRADFPLAHNNLGIVLARQGKLSEAWLNWKQRFGWTRTMRMLGVIWSGRAG